MGTIDLNKINFNGGSGGGGGTSNFNDLQNRPKYNGSRMTDSTDIPEVKTSEWDAKAKASDIPTALSQLSEDSTHRIVTDSEKSEWSGKQDAISDLSTIRSGATAGATAYQKPSDGIPSTDMTTEVQTTLGKVTELEQNVGDLDDLDTTAKTNLVAAVNEVKGEADGKADKVSVASSIPAGGLLPNTLYNVGTLTGNVTINLATPTDSTIMNIYHICFETGATAPTITWGSTITSWMGGSAPTINANKHYEVNVLNGVGIAMEV